MDEYFNGRWGTSAPNYNNSDWQRGNQERLNDLNRQQQERQAAERSRIDQATKAWSEAIKPPPPPAISRPTSTNAAPSNAGVHVGRTTRARPEPTYASGGGGYEPSLWDNFVDLIFAPFRLAWALVKFGVKAALILGALALAVAAYRAATESKSGGTSSTLSTAPAVATSVRQQPTFQPSRPTIAEPAVPAPTVAEPVVEEPAVGEPQFPHIGADVDNVSREDIDRLELEPAHGGAIVRSVAPGSPASNTRLHPDDVIVSLNYRPVSNRDELIELVHSQRSGVRVPIVFLRGGLEYTENITPKLE